MEADGNAGGCRKETDQHLAAELANLPQVTLKQHQENHGRQQVALDVGIGRVNRFGTRPQAERR